MVGGRGLLMTNNGRDVAKRGAAARRPGVPFRSAAQGAAIGAASSSASRADPTHVGQMHAEQMHAEQDREGADCHTGVDGVLHSFEPAARDEELTPEAEELYASLGDSATMSTVGGGYARRTAIAPLPMATFMHRQTAPPSHPLHSSPHPLTLSTHPLTLSPV